MNKTIVSLSFDDGREDFYRNAYTIMKKYGLSGTLNITTGYIDGSWNPDSGWLSTKGPVSIKQLREMQEYGIEIAFHGDKHVAECEDFLVGTQKMKDWGIYPEKVGFSYPDSQAPVEGKKEFINFAQNYGVLYIRGGRESNCYRLLRKSAYVFYQKFHSQHAFNYFNRPNIINIYSKRVDVYSLPSVVIKSHDKSDMLIGFIDKYPENWIILMLHSILNSSEERYGKDNWCWDCREFSNLCKYLSNNKKISVISIANVVNQIGL